MIPYSVIPEGRGRVVEPSQYEVLLKNKKTRVWQVKQNLIDENEFYRQAPEKEEPNDDFILDKRHVRMKYLQAKLTPVKKENQA